ncbi:hypothetical protein [Sorangium atrum]|uniref:Uncharacterized protein n=1 Tax=Sorangium atrum TaxID=2995308 RepID=A0ABT5C9C7_9BACT|nr:hypothetical protein [Sorangium aterium]MDC0682364.1 hypothetical protein [Sorangium aterium]
MSSTRNVGMARFSASTVLFFAAGAFAACAVPEGAEPSGDEEGAGPSGDPGELQAAAESTAEADSELKVNDCVNPHPFAGCNDAAVQSCVCAADPFCCNTQWDSLCAAEVTSLHCVPPSAAVIGRLQCAAPDGAGTVTSALAFAPLSIPGLGSGVTDANGDFRIPISSTASASVHLDVTFDGVVSSSGVTTPLTIMDDLHAPRGQGVDVAGSPRSSGDLDVDVVTLSGVDCELWRLGVDTLRDFHAARGAQPPAHALRMLRWSGVYVGTPFTFYDYINIRTDFLTSTWGSTAAERRRVITHEFGHSVRHVADGDLNHWNGDDVAYVYGRSHDGSEIANPGYAFNEGFANYWEQARVGARGRLCGGGAACPSTQYRDWNEKRIANALLDLSDVVGDGAMIQVLEANPGAIHSLYEFQARLHVQNPAVPAPAAVPACPPGFSDDGATCSSTVAKPSYGRGVGTAPTLCGAGQQYDAGLCYPACASGYYGVGPVCWQSCPSGYSDDGLTCRRDAQIINANNSACPWYDACGLTFAKGCSTCPTGYTNDGCTCRRDAHIFAKSSYGRGAGSVPTSCGAGQQYDAGLCYPACASGYSGAGPVCWGSCPVGYIDFGATCTKVISK